MRTIKICLAFNEADYSTALAMSLMRVNRFLSIGEYAKESYDLLLTDDPTLAADQMVYFTDEQMEEKIDEDKKIFIVYKYQPSGRISKILKLAYSLYSEMEMLSQNCEEANIISVCSSTGGTGCTSVAMGLCMELSRFHQQRVLYLNLEEFESTGMFFGEDCGGLQNITGYLYRVVYEQGGKIPSVVGYLTQNEHDIYAFRPSRGRNPLRELNESEFVKFMNAVLKEGLFSHVIVDCGTGMDDAIISAMRLSSKVCHLSSKSSHQTRTQTYLQTAKHKTGATDQENWVFVSNFQHMPYADLEDNLFFKDETGNENQTETSGFKIPTDASSFAMIDGHMKIEMDKWFGNGVRNLLANIGAARG
jgi:hypothetical protein